MTKNEIMNLDLQGVETRLAAIKAEMDTDGANLTELSEEVDYLTERREAIKADKDTRAKINAAVAAGAGVVIKDEPETRKKSLEDITKTRAYEDAYVTFVKTGDDKEARALLTNLATEVEEGSSGSVPVPYYVQERIETAWSRSVLTERARQAAVAGVFEVPFEYSATGATKHREGKAAPAEEVLELGTVRIDADYLKKWITVSDKVMALTGRDFLDYLYDEIEQRIAEAADNEIVTAIKNAPAVSSKTAIGVPVVTTTLSFGTIFEALAELADNVESPVAVMSRKAYFNEIMQMTDKNGRPIYNIVADNGSPRYYINGVEVLFNSTLTYTPGEGGTVEMLVGDLNGILVNRPEGRGARFTFDPYSLSEKNLVKIVGKELIGAAVVRPESWTRVTATIPTQG